MSAERLVGLVAEFDGDTEEERTPLLDAMEAAGGSATAREMAGAPGARERRSAARVMELLPDEGNVEALGTLVRDGDPAVARAARHALRGQVRTPAWYALVEALAHDADPDLAAAASGWLTEGIRG